MRCPSCLAILETALESCPECGLTLSALDRKFGTVPRNFLHLTDYADYFDEKQRAALGKKIARMERGFQELYLSVITLEISSTFNPREYVFWLVNRCHVGPIHSRLENSFVVVLFFEPQSKRVLLTTGYGLDDILPEDVLSRILKKAVPCFRNSHFYQGVLLVLSGINHQLLEHDRRGIIQPSSEVSAAADIAKPVEDLF